MFCLSNCSWLRANKYSWGCQFGPLAQFFFSAHRRIGGKWCPTFAWSESGHQWVCLRRVGPVPGNHLTANWAKPLDSRNTTGTYGPWDSGWSSTQLARGFIIWLLLRRIAWSKQRPFPICWMRAVYVLLIARWVDNVLAEVCLNLVEGAT